MMTGNSLGKGLGSLKIGNPLAGAITKGNITAGPSAFKGGIGSSAAPGGGIGGVGNALTGGVGSFFDGIGDIFGGLF